MSMVVPKVKTIFSSNEDKTQPCERQLTIIWCTPGLGSDTSCNLTLQSEMREKHHGTQPLFVLSQFAECLAKELNQFLPGGKNRIVQVFLSQFLPQSDLKVQPLC